VSDETDLDRHMQQIASLIQDFERVADPHVRAAAQQLVHAVLEMHRAGLERTLEIVRGADSGRALVALLAGDRRVASLLLVHGLHPVDFESRVTQAIDTLCPRLRAHGYLIDRVSITTDNAIHLTLAPTGRDGTRSAAAIVRHTVETALYETAADLTSLEIDGVIDDSAFVPLSAIRGRSSSSASTGEPVG
jgi:hypothetical protein